MDFTFTPHAIEKMQRRAIPLQIVLMILNTPATVTPAYGGRSAYQGDVTINGKQYILRIIVESGNQVVTLYLTSKIKKYGDKL